MSHTLKMIPMLNADSLPSEVIEWCLDHDYPLHGSHDIAEVDLKKENPMWTWLTEQGYQFSQKEIDWGWGHVAIFGS